jgi:hypothetical protein
VAFYALAILLFLDRALLMLSNVKRIFILKIEKNLKIKKILKILFIYFYAFVSLVTFLHWTLLLSRFL